MKQKHKIWLLFCLALVIKISSAFLMSAPIIYQDEPCILIRAAHFAETLKLEQCTKITTLPDGADSMPLYSILISPLYLFLNYQEAFYGALVINALLNSSLIFPIFYFYKKISKKENKSLIFAFITLFLHSIFTYEKTVMTETLFLSLSIWSIYFYFKSFEKNRIKNLSLSLIFSILGTLTRPFGFIIPLGVLFNEYFKSKKKKALIPMLILNIFLISLVLNHFYPDIIPSLLNKLSSLNTSENISNLLISTKNGINSLIVGTFFIPLIIFIDQINKDRTKVIKKTKLFIFFIITSLLLINIQHIYSYYLSGNEINLLIRYLNLPVVIITIFGIGYLLKGTYQLNKKSVLLFLVFLIFLFFWGMESKQANNLSITAAYANLNPDIFNPHFKVIFITMATFFFYLLRKYRQFLLTLFLTSVTLFSFLNLHTLITKVDYKSEILEFFKPKSDQKIVYYLHPTENNLADAWKLISLTNNTVNYRWQHQTDLNILKKNYNYIISSQTLPLPIAKKMKIDLDNTKEKEKIDMKIYEIK